MADNIEGMNINSTVKYRTKVSSDPNTYIGEIQSMMNFHAAITMGCDAIAITNQVKLEYDILPAEALNYFSIRTDRGDLIVAAKEWILEESFFILGDISKLTLEILEVSESDKDTIAGILISNGFPNIRFI